MRLWSIRQCEDERTQLFDAQLGRPTHKTNEKTEKYLFGLGAAGIFCDQFASLRTLIVKPKKTNTDIA